MEPDTECTDSISRHLAQFAYDFTLEAVPAAIRTRAKHLILDSVGIALASHRYPFSSIMLRGVEALGEGGTSPVIGSSAMLTPRNAVLMNAGLMHGLDFDDTHIKGILHATAFCAPVALVVAHGIHASGAEALASYIVGMEVAIRIATSAKGAFHNAGFHPTGLVAHFAAALAAGRLYGLDIQQLTMAQGIAASTASGVQVFLEEGAWSKRIHPGWGGVAGMTAARLAQHGFRAPSRPYEGRFGLFDSYLQKDAAKVDHEVITADLGTTWETSHVAIKPYPVCHVIHACAEAAADLNAQKRISPDEIVGIRCLIPGPTMAVVAEPLAVKRKPSTDYEAKFSAPFVTAASLVRGRFGLAELEPQVLNDPVIQRLSSLVECVADPDTAFPTFYSGGVEVETRDGSIHRVYHTVNRGAGERLIENEEIVEKYSTNARMTVSSAQADRIRDAILSLDSIRIDDLWRALRVE